MQHVLMAYATNPPPGPGVFKVAGHAVPSVLGQVLHWIAKLSLILSLVLIVAILKLRERTPLWQMVVMLVLGAVVLPHTSQNVAKGVNTVTSGDSVASTGASIGLILLAVGLVLFTFIVPPILRKRAAKATGAEGGEE